MVLLRLTELPHLRGIPSSRDQYTDEHHNDQEQCCEEDEHSTILQILVWLDLEQKLLQQLDLYYLLLLFLTLQEIYRRFTSPKSSIRFILLQKASNTEDRNAAKTNAQTKDIVTDSQPWYVCIILANLSRASTFL